MLCLTEMEGADNPHICQTEPAILDESLLPSLDAHLNGDKCNSVFPNLEHPNPEYHQPNPCLSNARRSPAQCSGNAEHTSALFSDISFDFHDGSYNFLLDFGADASSNELKFNANSKQETTFEKSLESIPMFPTTGSISGEHSSGSPEHNILALESVDESTTGSDPSQCSSYPLDDSSDSDIPILLNPLQTEPFVASGYWDNHDHHYERHYSAPLTTSCKFLKTSTDGILKNGNDNVYGYDNQVFYSDSTEAGDLMFTPPALESSGIKRQQKTSRGKRKRTQNANQRKAATVRERRRTGKLNGAFKALKEKVPTFSYESKLSRIETLRLAMTYIGFMTDLLKGQTPSEIKLMPHTSIKGLAALSLEYYD